MNARPTLYLAGPDVFLPDPEAVISPRRALAAARGYHAVFPLDLTRDLDLPPGPALARAIFEVEAAAIRDCAALIANLTPFRGPSADVGTAWELGCAVGLGRPVAAWSDVAGDYAARVGGGARDGDGMEIEDFGLPDNLMLACCLPGGIAASFEAALAALPPA